MSDRAVRIIDARASAGSRRGLGGRRHASAPRGGAGRSPAARYRFTRGSPCSCGSSRTTRITVARCRRRWAFTGSASSTSGPASRGSRP